MTGTDELLDQIERVAGLVYDLRTERHRISRRLRDRIGERDGWACRICSGHVDRDLTWQHGSKPDLRGSGLNDRYPSIEHILPVAMGGTNVEGNLAICHYGCNARRGRDGRQAPNYAQVQAARHATDVLNAVDRARGTGWDPTQSDNVSAWKVEELIKFLKGIGRASEVPDAVRAWARAALREASGRGYHWGTVERLERQAAERRALRNGESG